VQFAILEHKLKPAPKKAKKVFFNDPFIYHAINAWLKSNYNIEHSVKDPNICSTLVETAVISNIKRHFETMYIKQDGEVDIAYINGKKFFPIEINWTQQLRENDLKQIQKYSNGTIWAKVYNQAMFHKTSVLPLLLALYNFHP